MIKYVKSSRSMDKNKIEKLATEIKQFLDDNCLNGDCRIYFNGKCWDHGTEDDGMVWDETTKEYRETDERTPWKTIENINPRDYFEFAGGIISMSSEGSFYYVINPWYADFPNLYEKYQMQFEKILQKYGCYFEPGEAWNLSIYEA